MSKEIREQIDRIKNYKILKEETASQPEGRWVNGMYLDNDQILGIITSDHRHWERYYFNHKINQFVPVILMNKYNIDDFDCTKDMMGLAKKAAIKQDLISNDIEISRVRAKL